jgi:hypothetical protein
MLVCNGDVQASEFWQMTAQEVMMHIEARIPKHVGGISESELERMHKKRAELEAQGIEVL